MKEKMFKNLSLKILSAIFAVVLWTVIVNVYDPTTSYTFSNVSVQLINTESLTDKNYSYEIVEGGKISVYVSGPKSIVTNIKASDIVATADLSKISAFADYVDIHVSVVKDGQVLNNVEATPKTSAVRLSIENRDTKTVNVVSEITGSAADGYAVVRRVLNPTSVKVTGPSSVIDNIDHAGISFDVTGATADVTGTADIHLYDSDNNEINDSSVELTQTSVGYTAQVVRTKTVSIEVKTSGKPADGYRVSGVTLNRDSVVVYGENSQSAAGEELLNQSFVPVVNSWNHIVLDKPVTITDKDMWIGVKLEGFDSDKYYIGIDAGKALRGFGDVVNVGGETWWSMGDLGINSNFCIRANVTGDRTPAISWLTMDKKDFNIAANQKQTVNADLDATKLAETLYEAVIEIKSNDALTKVVKIPVYMTNGTVTGLDKNEMLQSSIRFNADRSLLIVESGSDMKRVVLTDIAGKNRKDVNNIGQQVELSLAGLNTGIYILSIEYTDGNKETIKLPVTR